MLFALSDLPLHRRARITRIVGGASCAEGERNLIEIGLEEGKIVEVLHRGLFGNPLAVQSGEHVIAIRRENARFIEVEPLAAGGVQEAAE